MSFIQQPVRIWHAALAIVVIAAIAVGGTAIAVGAKSLPRTAPGPGPAKTVARGGDGSTIEVKTFDNPAGQKSSGITRCPQGTRLLGGGVVGFGIFNQQQVNGSFPFGSRSWRAYMDNVSGQNLTFNVYAICK